MSDWIVCSRCGRDATPEEMREAARIAGGLPNEWEGPPPVCPDCQYAEWHPRCTTTRVESGTGARLDLAALARGESITVEIARAPVLFRSLDEVKALPPGELGFCDYVDLDVSWTSDDPCSRRRSSEPSR